MSRFIILFLSIVLSAVPAFAQDEELFHDSSENMESFADSVRIARAVFDHMPKCVVINQSAAVRSALESHILENEGKMFNGFRVRIFLSSAQSARDASARAYNLFNRMYPDIPAYRIYDNPNFRVTVGNFRTRLEADTFAKSIKGTFPTASVMRERFKYPAIGRTDMTARDTTEMDIPLYEE